jgi:acetyltransferase-like isoleucine patch superfamily enzyme
MRLIFKANRYLKERILIGIARLAVIFQVSANRIIIGRAWTAYGTPDMITHGNGSIVIGNQFKFNSGQHFNIIGRNQKLSFQVWGKLTIGDHVRMSGTTIICKNSISIGDNVMIGGNVVIYDSDFHSLDASKRNAEPEDRTDVASGTVTICNGAFIGAHTTILKGVVIGENSIVGLGSVVTGHIPANEIWAGNPARFVRKLN